MKKLFAWVYNPVLYVLHALFFPILIRDFKVNIRVYKEVASHIRSIIALDGDFKKFLDDHGFQEDKLGLGRLYSVQNINEKLANGLNDHDLNIVVKQTLAEKYEFLARQGFIEMLLMKTKRIDRTSYVLILEIANFGVLKEIFYHMLVSVGLWALICRILWVFYLPEVLQILEPIKSFFIHIL